MIYTSYYANLRHLPDNVIPIAISCGVPKWYVGAVCRYMAPRWDTVWQYKNDGDTESYTAAYLRDTLGGHSVEWALSALYLSLSFEARMLVSQGVSAWYQNPNRHVALLCYEKPEDFCHRHLLADWFKEQGVQVEEWR